MVRQELRNRKHLMAGFYCTILLCISWQQSTSQIFPGLVGEALVTALQEAYTPGQLLNDTQAKDTLYAKIFIEGDSVRCIYSGFARHLPEGADPSQWLYGSGLEVESINLEHSWPQSKGAGEGTNGNMDMHHLFPSRTGINSDRGDFPYAEINDNTTQRWYYLGIEMSSIPATNIDAYSEFVIGTFEPRESVKGDIARALFYFWTIYRDDAIAADPAFFESQLTILCQWHEEDPVDDFETLRNQRIATYQDGKVNPFIVDCSLVKRAYCGVLPDCAIVSTEENADERNMIQFFSPSNQFSVSGQPNRIWHISISDVLGRIYYINSIQDGIMSEPLDLRTGVYFILATHGQDMLVKKCFIQ